MSLSGLSGCLDISVYLLQVDDLNFIAYCHDLLVYTTPPISRFNSRLQISTQVVEKTKGVLW